MKNKVDSYLGYEVGDRVVCSHLGLEGTVIGARVHPEGYLFIKWDDGSEGFYGFSKRPISDISLLV